MPDSCCAIGCTNRRTGVNKSLPFYRVPSGKGLIAQCRRGEWLKAIGRNDWKSQEQISRAKLCGAHFISGKKSDDPNDPDWIPSIFLHSNGNSLQRNLEKRRKQNSSDLGQAKRMRYFVTTSNVQLQQHPPDSTADPKPWKTEPLDSFDGERLILFDPAPDMEALLIDAATQVEDSDPVKYEVAYLKKQVAMLDSELRARNEEVYKLRAENEHLRSTYGLPLKKK